MSPNADRVAALIHRAIALVNLCNHPDWQVFMEAMADEGTLIENRFHACNNADERAVLQGESRHNRFVKNIVGVYIQRAQNAKRSKESGATLDNAA